MNHPAKILSVDDNAVNLDLLDKLIQALGHRSSLAENGVVALKKIRAQPPDLILLDILMPEMDGYEVLEKLKSDPSLRHIPVIMISALDEIESVVRCIEKGADDYLVKPFNSTLLRARISACLEKKQGRDAEQRFLKETLRISAEILTEMLSAASPIAFGQVSRLRPLVRQLAVAVKAEKIWELDLAVMLSQTGCVGVPATIVEKALRGAFLLPEEKTMFSEHPEAGYELISRLPGLAKVAAIIRYQNRHFVGDGSSGPVAEDIPLGARILHVAIDFDILVSSRMSPSEALVRIKQRTDYYDPAIVKALASVVRKNLGSEVCSVMIAELVPGMILAEDIRTKTDVLIATKGRELSPSLIKSLDNFARTVGISEPIKVTIPSQKGGGDETGDCLDRR